MIEELQITANVAFIASTGRTATTFLATALGTLPGVRSLHEGHNVEDKKSSVIPPINMEHRKAWHDLAFAEQLVTEKRSEDILLTAAGDFDHIIDVAYYNCPLVKQLFRLLPRARFIVIFRRCESFVRSATTLHGEDPMPVGWPAIDKTLSTREQFIEFGRLKPARGSKAADEWPKMSAIQKNIWLWETTNEHLYDFCHSSPQGRVTTVFYEDLSEDSDSFWNTIFEGLGIPSEPSLLLVNAMVSQKMNSKQGGYQVPPAAQWSRKEREHLVKALLLEERIYESRHTG